MTVQHQEQPSLRPQWMPHPVLLGLIAILWGLAAVAQSLSPPVH